MQVIGNNNLRLILAIATIDNNKFTLNKQCMTLVSPSKLIYTLNSTTGEYGGILNNI